MQALRDLYLVNKAIEEEEYGDEGWAGNGSEFHRHGLLETLRQLAVRYRQLFTIRRLRNALISTSTVALCQQLCGSESLPRIGREDM
jgi:hypothetical protein